MADIEAEIVVKGLTPADIEANIVSEHYFTGANGCHGAWVAGNEGPRQATYPATLEQLTFCVLILRNGFKAVGVNYGHVDPGQHSETQGRKEARAQAVEKVWELMVYELRSKLHDAAPKVIPYTARDVASYKTDPHRHMTVFKFNDGTTYTLDWNAVIETGESPLEIAARKHTQATGGKKP